MSEGVMDIIGGQVDRLRAEELDRARALFRVLVTGGTVAELKTCLVHVPIHLIDKYRLDLNVFLEEEDNMRDTLKGPGDPGYARCLGPVDSYMAMILVEGDYEFEIYPDAEEIIEVLLDAGSFPEAGKGLDRSSGSEFDDDPEGKRKYDRIAALLKYRRNKPIRDRDAAKRKLALGKMLSERLGAASSAAKAGNIMDVLESVSEALVDADPDKPTRRATTKKKRQSKSGKRGKIKRGKSKRGKSKRGKRGKRGKSKRGKSKRGKSKRGKV